jgi:hypothetical protein
MHRAISTETVRRNLSRWLTAAWIGLLLLGGFYLFRATNNLLADARTAYRPTTLSPSVSGISRPLSGTSPRRDRVHDPVERGYAPHGLVYAILFLAIPLHLVRTRVHRPLRIGVVMLLLLRVGLAANGAVGALTHDERAQVWALVAVGGPGRRGGNGGLRGPSTAAAWGSTAQA